MGNSRVDPVDLARVARNFRKEYDDFVEVFNINHPAVRDTFRTLDDQISILENYTDVGYEYSGPQIYWIIQVLDAVITKFNDLLSEITSLYKTTLG